MALVYLICTQSALTFTHAHKHTRGWADGRWGATRSSVWQHVTQTTNRMIVGRQLHLLSPCCPLMCDGHTFRCTVQYVCLVTWSAVMDAVLSSRRERCFRYRLWCKTCALQIHWHLWMWKKIKNSMRSYSKPPLQYLTMKEKNNTHTPLLYLSMKRAVVHTLFSDWKQTPGSHCTCWATALWTSCYSSLSLSPGKQLPQHKAVQQLPHQRRSIPTLPYITADPLIFLGKWQFQVIHTVAFILKASFQYSVQYMSHCIENIPSGMVATTH